jgi:glycosyltransferase involved in cell wall biosynthesis
MSGIYVHAPRYAKWRYGARVILHRGSRHILSQKDILAHFPQSQQVTPFIVRRERKGYAVADRLAIPSTHVAESFYRWSELTNKLFISPYGVNLDQFPLRTGFLPSDPTVLFVGHWSYRKGVDILVQAIEAMDNVRLVHVGSLLDVPFPDHPRFVHHDPVPQWQLKTFYEAAHVFALASREEGLAVVQCQALASGLRLVCTDRTGGSDLVSLPGLKRLIRVAPAGDPDALRLALAQALEDAFGKTGVAPITETERQALSWRRYACQHLELISDIVRAP